KERVKACGVDQYARFAGKVLRQERRLPKSVVDNAKVSDHHAIIPTEQPVILEDLDDRERKIYDLVVNSFLAVLAEQYENKQTKIFTNIYNETFIAKEKLLRNKDGKKFIIIALKMIRMPMTSSCQL